MLCQIILCNKKKFVFCLLLIPSIFCLLYFFFSFPDSWNILAIYILISFISILLPSVLFIVLLCLDKMFFEKTNKENDTRISNTEQQQETSKENENIQITINKRFSLNTSKLLSEKSGNPLEKDFNNTRDSSNITAIMIPLNQKRSFSQKIKINNYFQDTIRNNSFKEMKKNDSLKRMIDSTKIANRSKSF
jgi:hypothetical protein